MIIYSVRDDSADYFLPPFLARTDAQAVRMFIGSLGDSFPYRHDFHLMAVGGFDQDTGLVTAEDAPRLVISGVSIDAKLDPRVSVAAFPGSGQAQEKQQ